MLQVISGASAPVQLCGFLVCAPETGGVLVYELLPQEYDRGPPDSFNTNGIGVRRYGYEHLPQRRYWKWKRKDGTAGTSMIVFASSRTAAISKWYENTKLIQP